MQLTVDEFLIGLITEQDSDSVANDDFGFYHPVDYVIHTWQMYLNMRLLPRMGGYDDQDELLMQDWQTLNRRMAYLKRKVNGEDEDVSAIADVPDAMNL